MNREAANKSMGFFAIYKEAYTLTTSNKKIFAQITLTILLPLAFFSLSAIRILTYLISRWIDIGWLITQILYLFSVLSCSLWSTSSIVYTVACIYTSRDITYRKVIGVLCKFCGKLIVTFLWCFLFLAIYTSVAFGLLLLWFYAYRDWWSITTLIFIICLSIPVLAGLTYMMVVSNIATVVTVLETDHYGRKALAKSIMLIKGKICASCAVFGLLGIAFTGIMFTYCYLVLFGNRISMVGSVFVGIACHLLLAVWIHILLVVHAVVYFVCKSVHDEDISRVATHSEVPVIHLGREQVKDVQLEQMPV